MRFTFTQSRKTLIVDCVKETTFFTGDPKKHDDCAKEILDNLIGDGYSDFEKTDYKAIKHKLYDLQHIVIDIHPVKEEEMDKHPYHIQQLYKYFKENKISLDHKLLVQDSDGIYLFF